MRGDKIPLITQYTITKTGTKTKKVPQYTLTTTEEIKAHQDKLGNNASWYYGTWCNKCCGVYPAFMKEQTFDDKGYYVCLVCGKESIHTDMPWQARDEWNAGNYVFNPQTDNYQMTISDWLSEK